MKIIEKSYKWNGHLSKRAKTEFIVLHHAASLKCSADDIHRIHTQNDWTGIGYHFYVRKDGSVYRGRPLDTIGAHTEGFNSKSIGICFEGNFEKEKMSPVQMNAGRNLLIYVKSMYPSACVKKHSDLNSTVCPGKNFPFDTVTSVFAPLDKPEDIVAELEKRGIMTNTALWMTKCASCENSYNLAKSICNKTKPGTERTKKLESINDIVWELWHRGLLKDTKLWLSLFENDKNLYWLGYKAANFTEER